MNRQALVAYAPDSIARGSKSFAMASRLFDRKSRERVWLLYAGCRKCDDMADGQDHGGAMALVDDPAARLAAIRDLTQRAMAGEVTGEELAIAAQLLGFGVHVVHELVDQGDRDLLDLALWVWNLPHENVASSVDAAFGGGV